MNGNATPAPALTQRLHQDDDGPVFNAPWEAQAFAMVHMLHENGAFTWSEWAESLTAAIKDAQAGGDADTGESYYQHWFTALERIVVAKKLVNLSALTECRESWRAAALRTPHGMPIILEPDLTD
jgi:nitrile hydratase accessory protein